MAQNQSDTVTTPQQMPAIPTPRPHGMKRFRQSTPVKPWQVQLISNQESCTSLPHCMCGSLADLLRGWPKLDFPEQGFPSKGFGCVLLFLSGAFWGWSKTETGKPTGGFPFGSPFWRRRLRRTQPESRPRHLWWPDPRAGGLA